ncbi:DUF2252 domain-containing protein [Tunturiibacter gelidoferens]|uniref:Uncharacterized protein (DUF2252 family) n=1 Tax=Tunturiibacter lichenicola TaxID=2051959 RepID=A0A7Y9NJD5_9BACT|nr:DUF2252 domain-containing protein [Edaphobacter lichenicola]NYF49883.1 uncharacterized protein (DUF2252 family) [Edaphobacter lichenicola]
MDKTQLVSARERYAFGRERRKQMKRLHHKTWTAKQRRESPLKLLEVSTRGRVPTLVALKNELMAASPFGYFRGAVPVMAYDLSLVGNTGICNQLCGDAHVRNLGAFAAPDGRLVFDINDFDETIVAPFEWDVKRMATSLVLAGRAAGAKNLHCREAAAVFLERYRTMMHSFARMPVLEVAKYQVHRLGNVSPVAGILRMAERATPMHTLLTLTEVEGRPSVVKKKGVKTVKGAAKSSERPQRVFRTIPPNLKRVTGALAEQVVGSLAIYAESLQPERRHFLAQYRPMDVAFKVVGTGSVGLRDYVVLMEGNGVKDPLFLQIKEEVASGYAPYVAGALKGRRGKQHQGQRVVNGERAMQLQSDPFLGWTTMEGRDYLVRQLNDHKASIQLEDLKAAGLLEYAGVCGEMLARGHARAGDSAMVAGYVGTSARFDEAVGAFAEAYADQTEVDWKQLVKSLKMPGKKAAK